MAQTMGTLPWLWHTPHIQPQGELIGDPGDKEVLAKSSVDAATSQLYQHYHQDGEGFP
jgi:hypothetical protein